MPCTESCQCHVEGDRGLEGEGAGSAAAPFVIEPEDGRTIPRTSPTFASLPVLGDEEIGQNAYVDDTGLNFVWAGVGAGTEIFEGWVPVAPRWSYATPSDLVLVDTDTSVTDTGLKLVEGAWFIMVRAILVLQVPVGVPDLGVTIGVRSADSVYPLGTETIQVSNADHATIIGFWRQAWVFATITVLPVGATPEFVVFANKSDDTASATVSSIRMTGIQLTGRNLSDI